MLCGVSRRGCFWMAGFHARRLMQQYYPTNFMNNTKPPPFLPFMIWESIFTDEHMGFEYQAFLCTSSAQESMAAQPPVLLQSPQGLFDGHNSVMSCVVDGWVARWETQVMTWFLLKIRIHTENKIDISHNSNYCLNFIAQANWFYLLFLLNLYRKCEDL